MERGRYPRAPILLYETLRFMDYVASVLNDKIYCFSRILVIIIKHFIVVVCSGMSVKEWNGYDLENCSYEVVKSFLGWWVESEGSTAELVVKKCRYVCMRGWT